MPKIYPLTKSVHCVMAKLCALEFFLLSFSGVLLFFRFIRRIMCVCLKVDVQLGRKRLEKKQTTCECIKFCSMA